MNKHLNFKMNPDNRIFQFRFCPKLQFPRSVFLSALLFVVGCSSQPEKSENFAGHKKSEASQTNAAQNKANLTPSSSVVGGYHAKSISGDYAGYPALHQFIENMVRKHSFDREYLNGLFSLAKRKQWTLDYLSQSDNAVKSKPRKGGWTKYRSQFIDQRHINGGVAFWQEYQPTLQRASREYGVPAEYILGIMGVETGFGGNVGKHRVLDALTTLSFDYQRRGDYFRGELENFLLMARNENIDPIRPLGSFAGAMGLGQFMPSSFLQWAVDFNNDGRRDLWNPQDSIGSIANYFARHGWQTGQPVVSATKGSYTGIKALDTGFDARYPLSRLNQAGVEPVVHCQCDYPLSLLLLRHQNNDEYLLGHPNFYVITRYNHSTYYAMAVYELAQAIKNGHRQSTTTISANGKKL